MMRSSPLMIVLALTFSALAVAQPMTGTYTVDSSLPTGSGNYATLQEASDALVANGVGGPVIIAVNPGVNPYAGFFLVSPIPGASAVNSVTFVAIGPVVVSGIATGFTQAIRLGTAAVTTLGGPSYITIEGFEVTGVPTGAGIIATGCTNITIKGCTVHTSGSGIYFGATTDSVIEDCIVYGVSNTCGAPGSATYAGAISTYYNSHNVTIRRNRVFDCLGNGIFVGSSGSTTAPNNNIVINNSVSNTPGLGSYPGGIAIRRSGGSTFSNNSVSMPANSTFGGFHLQGSSADPQPVEISNNIIRHEGSGPCFRFETTTIIPPATFDYNLYDVAGSGPMGSVAAVPTANLAAWQALLAPNMVGRELNSLEGPAGFTAPNDLHISPASLAFNSGSAVTLVTDDIDGQIRPLNGVPDRGCDETQGQGLFASFSAAVTSGPAPFTASFLDNSFTSDPGGILTWAWDFQNDGIVDSNQQSPSFNYLCPGTYSVSLTVTDAANPSSSFVRTSYITVTPFLFNVTSSGGGVADMSLTPVPTLCGPAQGTFKGYTLVSGATAGNVGSGPFFGIGFDAITLQFIQTPPDVGNVIHFVATPTTYPNTGTLTYPPGFFAPLVGLTLDAVMVFQAPNGSLLHWSNVSRVSF